MPTTRPTTITQIETLLRTIDVADADEQTLTATPKTSTTNNEPTSM